MLSGASDPRCKLGIFMGKTDKSSAIHLQQSMILVPMDSPGVHIVRPLTVFGFDDAPRMCQLFSLNGTPQSIIKWHTTQSTVIYY